MKMNLTQESRDLDNLCANIRGLCATETDFAKLGRDIERMVRFAWSWEKSGMSACSPSPAELLREVVAAFDTDSLRVWFKSTGYEDRASVALTAARAWCEKNKAGEDSVAGSSHLQPPDVSPSPAPIPDTDEALARELHRADNHDVKLVPPYTWETCPEPLVRASYLRMARRARELSDAKVSDALLSIEAPLETGDVDWIPSAQEMHELWKRTGSTYDNKYGAMEAVRSLIARRAQSRSAPQARREDVIEECARVCKDGALLAWNSAGLLPPDSDERKEKRHQAAALWQAEQCIRALKQSVPPTPERSTAQWPPSEEYARKLSLAYVRDRSISGTNSMLAAFKQVGPPPQATQARTLNECKAEFVRVTKRGPCLDSIDQHGIAAVRDFLTLSPEKYRRNWGPREHDAEQEAPPPHGEREAPILVRRNDDDRRAYSEGVVAGLRTAASICDGHNAQAAAKDCRAQMSAAQAYQATDASASSARGVTPTQPIVTDEHGVRRFKANAIVAHIVDWCARKNGTVGYDPVPDGEPAPSLNEIARMKFSREDRAQLAQLIGYSLSGYGELDYTDPVDDSTPSSSPKCSSAPTHCVKCGEPHALACVYDKANAPTEFVEKAKAAVDLARDMERQYRYHWRDGIRPADPEMPPASAEDFAKASTAFDLALASVDAQAPAPSSVGAEQDEIARLRSRSFAANRRLDALEDAACEAGWCDHGWIGPIHGLKDDDVAVADAPCTKTRSELKPATPAAVEGREAKCSFECSQAEIECHEHLPSCPRYVAPASSASEGVPVSHTTLQLADRLFEAYNEGDEQGCRFDELTEHALTSWIRAARTAEWALAQRAKDGGT